jgi:ribonuclease D
MDMERFDSKLKEYFQKEILLIEIKSLIENQNLKLKKLGLDNITQEILNIKLCKSEKLSNWNIRPLRKRQIHYAALDSFVLLQIHDNLLSSNL